jgi:hypothetical protein
MKAQTVVDARDSFNQKFREANALVDVLSNCRAEQLHDETVPCIARMLSEIVEALETLFEDLADAIEKDAGALEVEK